MLYIERKSQEARDLEELRLIFLCLAAEAERDRYEVQGRGRRRPRGPYAVVKSSDSLPRMTNHGERYF